MAGFTTTITEFSDSENRRKYAIDGHTVQAPRVLIQKRKEPSTSAGIADSELMVVYGTTDADSEPLSAKVVFSASVRFPANGQSSDVTAALAVFRDMVASDEFTNLVNSQEYVQ
jgi:hypothetical protein